MVYKGVLTSRIAHDLRHIKDHTLFIRTSGSDNAYLLLLHIKYEVVLTHTRTADDHLRGAAIWVDGETPHIGLLFIEVLTRVPPDGTVIVADDADDGELAEELQHGLVPPIELGLVSPAEGLGTGCSAGPLAPAYVDDQLVDGPGITYLTASGLVWYRRRWCHNL